MPTFDLGEAINHGITAIVTFGSVIVAGRMAVADGIRQLRLERQLDIQLDSYRKTLAALDEFQEALKSVIVIDAHFEESFDDIRDQEVELVRAKGERLKTALGDLGIP